MAIQPTANNLLVEPIEDQQVTAGGIVLPDTAKEKPQKGKILAIGPGRINNDGKRIPVDEALKVGATVLFKKYSTTEVKDGEKDLYIIEEDGVLAIIG